MHPNQETARMGTSQLQMITIDGMPRDEAGSFTHSD
jgi:hypothetical protein